MGYRLNRLNEPIFMAGPKPMRTEFGIPSTTTLSLTLLIRGPASATSSNGRQKLIPEPDTPSSTNILMDCSENGSFLGPLRGNFRNMKA